MAKNLSGDLQVASANRLGDGVVVYLGDDGQWTQRLDLAALARDRRAGEPAMPAVGAARPRQALHSEWTPSPTR